VSSVGAPDIHRAFPSSYAELTAALLIVPGVLGLLLEPPLFLLADRWPRRWFIAGGTAVMAVGFALCAAAPTAWWLAGALALTYVADGIAVNLAQATLVELYPERRASVMARWSLLGLIGDLGTPAVLIALAWLGLGWRAAFGLMAALLGLWAILLARQPLSAPTAPPAESGSSGGGERAGAAERAGGGAAAEGDGGGGAPAGMWRTLAAALRHKKLIVWLFGTTLCDLLDEIFVVLGSLRLRGELGVGAAWTGIVMMAYPIGGAIGLVICDRLARRLGAARLLALFCAACACAFVLWLAATSAAASAALMLLVGATAAPLYPLACAQAYAALPGRSGAVLAAGHLFTPLSLALPLALGAAADRWGVVAALALLVAQPVGLGLLALTAPIEEPGRFEQG
jgi:predicted MFS family arabinose efflux permease